MKMIELLTQFPFSMVPRTIMRKPCANRVTLLCYIPGDLATSKKRSTNQGTSNHLYPHTFSTTSPSIQLVLFATHAKFNTISIANAPMVHQTKIQYRL